jgi:murein DD-endopeptidase MepM/ murein hydrolase activator NlpD
MPRAPRAVLATFLGGAAGCGGGSPAEPEATLTACGRYPAQALSAYVLPWPEGTAHGILQGNCGRTWTHQGRFRFAYDVGMPIGARVTAARGGLVVAVEDRFEDGNLVPGQENYVFVQHDDGSVARYYHLTRGGTRVHAGAGVAAGDWIGVSGNTGFTGGRPHLHFDVTSLDCGLYFNGPQCSTLPVTFRNTRPHAGGLVEGETYLALPF